MLVVGGSIGKTGAPSLTAEAALRSGAGIVTACVPRSLNLVFEQRLVEVMTRPCADEDGVMTMDAADEILEAAERADAIALGPGLGRTGRCAPARRLSCSTGSTSRSCSTPTACGPSPGHLDWVFARDAPTVLTPHAGELGRLLGRESSWVSARRLKAVQAAPTTSARSCS